MQDETVDSDGRNNITIPEVCKKYCEAFFEVLKPFEGLLKGHPGFLNPGTHLTE